VEELSCVLVPGRLTPPLAWEAIFGRTGVVEIEIGCGKGRFLTEAARLRPGSDLVGVERAGKWFRRAVHRTHHGGLPNIRLVQADAFDFLARWVSPGSAAAVHVYFPDPWPKQRHGKRRLLQPSFYQLVARVLAPAGRFHFASDVESYFGTAVTEVAATGLFAPEPWPQDAPDRLPTEFAIKYAKEGRRLFYSRFVRSTAMEAVPLPVVPCRTGEGP
jgi:tRNA (guanine-N7-)-methyltransferase